MDVPDDFQSYEDTNGKDLLCIAKTGHLVDAQGTNHQPINSVSNGAEMSIVKAQTSEVSTAMHQYAYVRKGKTTLSFGQLEVGRQTEHDRTVKVCGEQSISTLDGNSILLNVHYGLPDMAIMPQTNKEHDKLPHATQTADVEWDPSILDCEWKDGKSSGTASVHMMYSQELHDNLVKTSALCKRNPYMEANLAKLLSFSTAPMFKPTIEDKKELLFRLTYLLVKFRFIYIYF